VLIVDGDPNGRPDARGADFLRTALAPIMDTDPGFLVKVINAPAFNAKSPYEPVKSRDNSSQPRVLILANLAGLSGEQSAAIEKFVGEGGSVLVALGDRAAPSGAHLRRQLQSSRRDQRDNRYRSQSSEPALFIHDSTTPYFLTAAARCSTAMPS